MSRKEVIAGVTAARLTDIELLAQLAASGSYKPVIDRCYPLEHAAEAHAYVDKGRKRGNVILTIAHDVLPLKRKIT
jgi:NADPH:quinone reductase-like Zn-dependent oxidoreductase